MSEAGRKPKSPLAQRLPSATRPSTGETEMTNYIKETLAADIASGFLVIEGERAMTINSFSDITTQYEVTLDSCECKGFRRWGHCQHNETLRRAYARAKAETFAGLRKQFDCRLQPVRVQVGKPVYTEAIDEPFFHPEWVAKDAERTAYLNYLLSIGA